MFNLTLDEKELQKIEALFKKTPERAEKILNSALRKAINYIAKENKEHIQDTYTPSTDLLGAKGLKKQVKNGEAILLASSKRNKIENFDSSSKAPERLRDQHIQVAIKKGNRVTMRTMFWAFYKSEGKRFKLGLYFRKGEDKNHITPARTVSILQMSAPVTEEQEKKLKEIFEKELVKKLSKENL
nr:MAG TPA: minor tail protein Z [Caudoviricetes sp.]